MNKKRSQTQYCFNIGLQPQSELRGVALLGHQTLAELHEATSSGRGGSADAQFSFSVGGEEVQAGTRLDDLNLRVGQTFEYWVKSTPEDRPESIAVDFIDNE